MTARSRPDAGGKPRHAAVARGEAIADGIVRAVARSPGYPIANAAFDLDRRAGGGLLAGALAFRLFGALLPFGLLIAVVLGYAATQGGTGDVAKTVGIVPSVLDSIAQSSKLSTGTRWTVGLFALFALMWAAVSAARAVRATHSLAWTGGVERFRRPLQAGLVFVATLVVCAGAASIGGRARAELGTLGGLLVTIGTGAVVFAAWMWVSRVLPHADAPWTALIPGTLVVAVGYLGLQIATVYFVAVRLERASATYGSFGAAFTILAWLYIASRVIVASAMLNAALWGRRN